MQLRFEAIQSSGDHRGCVLGRLHRDLTEVVHAPAPAHRGPLLPRTTIHANTVAAVKVASDVVALLAQPQDGGLRSGGVGLGRPEDQQLDKRLERQPITRLELSRAFGCLGRQHNGPLLLTSSLTPRLRLRAVFRCRYGGSGEAGDSWKSSWLA